MDSALAEQLVAVVAQEAEHCERLLSLLRRQQRHLVEGNTIKLPANVREQECAMRHSRQLEKQRQEILERLAQLPADGGRKPDLSRLIATLSDDYGRRLEQLRDTLAAAIQQVSKTKEQNTMLIERSLFNIGETMRLLAAANGDGGYAAVPAVTSGATGPLAVR